MTRRRLELPRVNLLCELEEGPRVSSEVLDVEHGLRVRKIREVHSQSCIDAISGAEIWDPTGDRHPCSCQHQDLFALMEKPHHVLNGVDVFTFLSFGGLRDVDDDLPQGHVVQVWREDGFRQKVSKDGSWIGLSDVLLEETI